MGSSSGLDLHLPQSITVFRPWVWGTELSCRVRNQLKALSDAGFGVKHISDECAALVSTVGQTWSAEASLHCCPEFTEVPGEPHLSLPTLCGFWCASPHSAAPRQLIYCHVPQLVGGGWGPVQPHSPSLATGREMWAFKGGGEGGEGGRSLERQSQSWTAHMAKQKGGKL